MAEEEINNANVVPEDNGVNGAVENEEDDLSPFPKARVVRLMREKIKDKIIRSEVKDAMNMWLGDITRKIAKEMSATQYASVSLADFQRATKPYDMIEDIVKDEQRLLLAGAGEAMLAKGAHGSLGVFIGFALIPLANVLMSIVMVSGKVFSSVTSYVGLVGNSLMVIYIILVTFVPAIEKLALVIAMPAGLLVMVWMIMFTIKLFKLSKIESH